MVIPLFVNGLFKHSAPIELLRVEESAGDLLLYVSGAMAFVGTMFLGWIAYKQNDDLKKIEESNFIANNYCIDLLRAVSLKNINKLEVNLDEFHEEQIVREEILESGYQSFRIQFDMDRMKNIPVYVHVSKIKMWFSGNKGEKSNSVSIFATACDGYYSKVAISEDKDFFELTVLMKPETKLNILKCMGMKGTLMMEIEMELVSPNYVMSKMKNRAKFSKSNEIDNAEFEIIDVNPLSFWNGSEIISKEDVKFRVET